VGRPLLFFGFFEEGGVGVGVMGGFGAAKRFSLPGGWRVVFVRLLKAGGPIVGVCARQQHK